MQMIGIENSIARTSTVVLMGIYSAAVNRISAVLYIAEGVAKTTSDASTSYITRA